MQEMQGTWVRSLGWEDSLEEETATRSNPTQSCWENPMDRGAWQATVHGAAESDTTEWLNTHKINCKYSSVKADLWGDFMYFILKKSFTQICFCCCLVARSCPTLETPWTVAHQALQSVGFPREEYWSGLPFPSPGDLSNPGIKPTSPMLAGRFFTTEPQGNPFRFC